MGDSLFQQLFPRKTLIPQISKFCTINKQNLLSRKSAEVTKRYSKQDNLIQFHNLPNPSQSSQI